MPDGYCHEHCDGCEGCEKLAARSYTQDARIRLLEGTLRECADALAAYHGTRDHTLIRNADALLEGGTFVVRFTG